MVARSASILMTSVQCELANPKGARSDPWQSGHKLTADKLVVADPDKFVHRTATHVLADDDGTGHSAGNEYAESRDRHSDHIRENGTQHSLSLLIPNLRTRSAR